MAVKDIVSPVNESTGSMEPGTVEPEPTANGTISPPPAGYDSGSGDEQSTIGSLHNNRLRLDLYRIRRQVSRRRSADDTHKSTAVHSSGSLRDIPREGETPSTPADPTDGEGDEPVVIDGGYGWVVAFGSFLANFCIAGTIKSYGLLNLQIVDTFQVTSAETAVVVGVLLTTGLLISPLVGALCERFTCRKVLTAGGILAFLGFSLSSLSTTVTHLCLTIGVLGGIGTGCTTTPGILITTRYFPTRRSMINGLVLAGNAAGGFAFPPLFQYMLSEFGLRGTLLLIGAMCLHVVTGAALSRPIAVHERILRWQRLHRGQGQTPRLEKPEPEKVPALPEKKYLVQRQFSQTSGSEKSEVSVRRPPSNSSLVSLAEKLSLCSAPPHETSQTNLKTTSDETRLVRVMRPGPDGQPHSMIVKVPARLRTSSLMLSTTDVTTDATSQFNDDIKRLREAETSCAPNLYRRVRRYLDLDLLKNPLFAMVLASTFFTATGAPYALMQMPVFGVSRGLTTAETAEVLSIVSAVDLVARLSFGWLFDQNYFPRQYAFALSQLLGGVSMITVPFTNDYLSIVALFILYSVSIGTWFVNLAPVLADFHGIDKIASSYGLARMFHGLSTLITPPIFGVITDRTGDYGNQFFAIGSCMFIGGLLVLAISAFNLDTKYGVSKTPPSSSTEVC